MDGGRFDRVARRFAGGGRSRRGLLAVAVAATTARVLGPAPEAAAEPVLDARCPDPGGDPQGFQRPQLAQSFRAKRSGLLVRATLWFTEAGASGTDHFSVAIQTADRKGRPTARVLAEAEIANIVNPADGETTEATADFTAAALGPARVKKGKRYALVVRGASGTSPFLQINLNGGCPGSVSEFDGDLGAWVRDDVIGDLVFDTFVERA